MLRVLTTHTFSSELLRAQAQALQKHLACDYVLTVVNDAQEDEHFSNHWRRDTAESLEATAKAVGARHIRFPQILHDERWRIFGYEAVDSDEVQNANTRCADAVQYGVDILLSESDEPLLIIDADMVPFRAVEVQELLGIKPIWGVGQNRGGILYLWNGLLLVDPRRAQGMELFDLNCAHINGTPCDVGGMLYLFLEENPSGFGSFGIMSARAHTFSDNGTVPISLRDFFRWDSDRQGNYRISETYGSVFAHLGGGGNWEIRDQEEADERMRRFIEAVS